MSKELKAGDRIRLSTGVMATVKEVFPGSTNSGVSVKTDDTGAVYVLAEIEALGISWELVEPELVEPPVGSVIRFTYGDSSDVALSDSKKWWIAGYDYSFTWDNLVQNFSITDYELLRPTKEVVKDLLQKYPDVPLGGIAKDYGVEL